MQSSPERKTRILLIEDDQDDYFLTTEVLSEIEGASYEVFWHSDAHDAASLFQSGKFDVALVDFQVGEWNGVDLIREATSIGFEAPLILLTGIQDRDVDIAAAEAGAADYLCKSQITPEVLERSIRYAMSTAEARNAFLGLSTILRTTLDNADTGIGAFNHSGQLIACNALFLQLLDLYDDAREIEGFQFSDPDSLLQLSERVVERISLASASDSSHTLHLTCGDKILEIRHKDVADGGTVTMCADMTERVKNEKILREAKKSAEESSRAKSAFLAGMSHELRTPLNAIIGFSELLRQETHGSIGAPQYAEYIEDIYNSGSDLLNIVNDILDLAKCESGTLTLNVSEVLFAEIVKSVVSQLQPFATAANVTIETPTDDNLVRLRADALRLRQILRNLLSNAIKFTPAGGTVRVSMSRTDDGDFMLSVTDTGIGISQDDLSRIRQPFQQVDNTLARQYEGTGLGVPLSCAMARLHDGEIDYQSEPGQGTTVTLRLPASRIVASDEQSSNVEVA